MSEAGGGRTQEKLLVFFLVSLSCSLSAQYMLLFRRRPFQQSSRPQDSFSAAARYIVYICVCFPKRSREKRRERSECDAALIHFVRFPWRLKRRVFWSAPALNLGGSTLDWPKCTFGPLSRSHFGSNQCSKKISFPRRKILLDYVGSAERKRTLLGITRRVIGKLQAKDSSEFKARLTKNCAYF